MTIYFDVGFRIMVVQTMEIVETAGWIVTDSKDSWWSTIVETAGGIVIDGRDSWWSSIVETAGDRRCW